MVIWLLSTKTSQVSSPALIKTGLFDPGSCSWTFYDLRWMCPTKKSFRFIQEKPTIQEISSRVAPSVVWMSLGRLSFKTFRISSSRSWHANVCSWSKMHPAKTRQPDGQSSVSGTVPHGCLHQWANLVNQLPSSPLEPFPLHPPHQVCW